MKDPEKAWLIEWRDLNCPKTRIENFVGPRIDELLVQLRVKVVQLTNAGTPPAVGDPIMRTLDILNDLKKQNVAGVANKHVLLEVAVRTAAVILNPQGNHDPNKYAQLIGKMEGKLPLLKILGEKLTAFKNYVVNVVADKKVKEVELAVVKTEVKPSVKEQMMHMKEVMNGYHEDAKKKKEEQPVVADQSGLNNV